MIVRKPTVKTTFFIYKIFCCTNGLEVAANSNIGESILLCDRFLNILCELSFKFFDIIREFPKLLGEAI